MVSAPGPPRGVRPFFLALAPGRLIRFPERHPQRQDVAVAVLAWQTGGLATVRLDQPSGRSRAMKRSAGISVALTVFALAWAASPSPGQTPAEFAQTAAFAAAHQNKDGGFAAKAGQASSLGATNSGLRVLLHVGGSVPDVLGCVKYVKSCRDSSGGFAPTPGGKPDVITTAVGLMAASELKIADPAMVKEAIDYLGKNAKSFEEVRMAIAGLEAVARHVARFSAVARADPGHARTRTARSARGRARPYATGGRGRGDLADGAEARQPRRGHQRDQGRPAPRRRLVQG